MAIVACVIIAGIADCSGLVNAGSDTPAATDTTTPQTSKQQEKESRTSPHDVVDEFSTAIGQQPSEGDDFTPSATEGEHTRLEYRLGAYRYATGVHAQYDGFALDVVAYQGKEPTMMRVYLDGDDEHVSANFAALAKVMDPSLSDDDIQSALDAYSRTGTMSYQLSSARSHKLTQEDSIGKIGAMTEAIIDVKIE